MSSIRFVMDSQSGAVKLWVLISFCMLPAVAIAQLDNTTSTPIPGVGHNYITDLNETVNPVNGALSVRIAAPRPRERGFNLPLYAYIYDSNGQFQVTPSWAYRSSTNSQYVSSVDLIQTQQGVGGTYPIPAGMFSSNGGLITGAYPNSGVPGTISQSSHMLSGYFGGGPSAGTYATCNYSDNYVYTDAQGNRHAMLGFLDVGAGQDTQLACGAFNIHPTVIGQTVGDGVYNFVFYGGSFPGVFDLHGNDLEFSGEDTNGNSANTTGRTYGMSDTIHPMSAALTVPGLGGNFTYEANFGARGQTSSFPFNPTPVISSSSCPTSFAGTVGGYSGSATLSLPNQQQYTFSVDPTFGLLKTINYPSGASVTYTWQAIPQSQVAAFFLPSNTPSQPCAYLYDWPSITKRVVSVNGIPTQEQNFAYTTTWDGGFWTEKTTTVTTKDLVSAGTPSYITKYYYVMGNISPLERKIEYYDVNGSLLKTVNKTWLSDNQLGGECTTLDDGTTSGSFYEYQFGTSLITSSSEYDFGAVATVCQKSEATPLRQTVTTYQTFSAPSSTYGFNPIKDRPSSVKIYGNGVLLSETDYGYDEVAVATVTPAPLGHDETNYAANSTRPRGNVTTVTQKCFAGSSTCVDSVTHYAYDETGQVISKVDAKGALTQYSYADSYSTDNGAPAQNTNTYLTSVTSPTVNGVTQTQTFKYGYNDGKLRSNTDANSKTTTFCYYIGGCASGTFDPWFRLTEITYPDGGATFTTYDDSAPIAKVTTRSIASPNPDTVRISSFDPLGRGIKTELSDALGTIYTDTSYDGFGRVSSVSNPYRSTTDSTYGINVNKYDALGRPTSQTHPDATASSWSYTGSVTNYKDELQQSWKRTSDALGRLTQVIEPGNYETDYQYDALGNLLCVEQHGGASGTGCTASASSDATSAWRPRRFTYDSLSRLLSSSNPESGTVQYSYDPNGNLIQKTSPSPNQASGTTTLGYCYDALNRMTAKFYGSPNCTSPSSGALVASYAYDTSTIPGAQNTIGRLTSESSIANGVAYSQRLPYVYDAMGRIKNERQCPLLPCATPNELQYTYDLSGNVTSSNNGVPNSGTPQIGWTNSYDAAGRLAKLQSTWDDATHPAVLFEADQTINGITPYGPFGLTAAQHGISPATPQASLLAETRAYDIRGRQTLKQVNAATVGSPSVPVITLSPMPLHLGAVGTATMSIVCPSMCGTMFWWVDGIYKGGAGVYDGGNISFYVGSDLSLGSHTLTVHYNGNGTIPASDSTPFTFSVINPAVTPEPISLILTPSSITLGTSTTAAISLPCGSNCTTGQLLIDGVRVAGTGFDAAGTARLSVGSSLTMGIHTATFAYNGDALYSPNSISASLTVIPPTVTISPMSLQLGATAKGTMGVTCITMCGTMGWFVDGVYKGGSGVDDGGNISFLFGSDLGLGSHILTVHYNGNGTSQASAADPINFNVVSPAAVPEPMTISISPATITQGGSSIVVVDLACGSSCNSGNLLVDGVRVAGTNFDATGSASLTIGSTLSQGTHIVTMMYPGDAAYAPNSATANLVVTSP